MLFIVLPVGIPAVLNRVAKQNAVIPVRPSADIHCLGFLGRTKHLAFVLKARRNNSFKYLTYAQWCY